MDANAGSFFFSLVCVYSRPFADCEQWRDWRANRLNHASDGGLTPDDYEARVSELPEHIERDPQKLQILLDLKAWGERLRAGSSAFSS